MRQTKTKDMRQTKKSGARMSPINKESTRNIRGRDEARERGLDETLAETFPASDPLSTDPDPAMAEDKGPKKKIAS